MTGAPKVSIGMPVYNAEDLLPQTLDSILAQTFQDFEVVLSDNASTDTTPEICRAYAARDPRVRHEPGGKNVGIVSNFNRAFRLARGTYFKWQAHDDLLGPEFLARCVEVLDRDPTAVLAGTRVGLIEEDGSPVRFDETARMFVTTYGERIPPPAETEALASTQRIERFRSVVFDVNGPLHAQLIFGLIRSEALARTPLIERYIGAEKVLMARLSFLGRFLEVPAEQFFRRYHPGHAGRSGRGTWRGRIRVAKSYAPERRVILFPFTRQIRGYLGAIRDAEIGAAEKLRATATVAGKVASVGVKKLGKPVRSR